LYKSTLMNILIARAVSRQPVTRVGGINQGMSTA